MSRVSLLLKQILSPLSGKKKSAVHCCVALLDVFPELHRNLHKAVLLFELSRVHHYSAMLVHSADNTKTASGRISTVVSVPHGTLLAYRNNKRFRFGLTPSRAALLVFTRKLLLAENDKRTDLHRNLRKSAYSLLYDYLSSLLYHVFVTLSIIFCSLGETV